jgi:hypothetical protein
MTVHCHLLGGMLVLCSVAIACAAAGPGGMKPGGQGLIR